MTGVLPEGSCGVRQFSDRLSDALAALDVDARPCWLLSDRPSPFAVIDWLRRVRNAVGMWSPDVVIVHYAAFSTGYRGIPWIAPLVAIESRRRSVPTIAFAHELGGNWRGRGLRGAIQAGSHRLAVVPTLRAAAAVAVPSDDRRMWVRSQRFLRGSEVEVIPVCNTVPVVAMRQRREKHSHPRVGVFGFACPPSMATITTQAVAALVKDGVCRNLAMVGHPGKASAAGHAWMEAAQQAGCPVEFTGILGNEELSEALSSLDLAIYPDPNGPTSRRTTLAALMAHGLPIIAFEGPDTWGLLRSTRAVALVDAHADQLAERLSGLLESDSGLSSLSSRARVFEQEHFSVERTSKQLVDMIDRVIRTPRKRLVSPKLNCV